MKTWYSIADNEKAGIAELSLFDEIGGWGVSLDQFANDFKAIKDRKNITLYLNSPGGDVFAGLGIYNLLSTVSDKLSVEVVGLAASIASVIMLAADERIVDDGVFVMIHDPSVFTGGNADDLRKDADTLDKIKQQIVNIYASRTGMDKDALVALMAAETWMCGEDAVKNGFATTINKKSKATNCLYNLSGKGFSRVPKNLLRPSVSIKDLTIRDYEQILRDVGFSNQEAVTLASKSGLGKKQESDSPVADEIAVLDEIKKAIQFI